MLAKGFASLLLAATAAGGAIVLPSGASSLAATLRTSSTLAGADVLVSDLFDDAGSAAGRVLGPSPAPGGRIVVEAAQLGAIARQFGVDWQPASAADRAVLERPGRLVRREDMLAALRAALQSGGAPSGFEIEMPGFTPPLVPPEAHERVVVDQLDYDASGGRFTALMAVTADGIAPARLRLSGRIDEIAELPIATHRLQPGHVLQADDLHIGKVRRSTLRIEVAEQPEQAVGMAVRTAVAAGQPVPIADLVRSAMIEKGAIITLVLESGGLALAAQGQALEAGAEGETIRVLNPGSHAVVAAVVIAPGRARVTPGSAPTLPALRVAEAANR
jgi:flagella basal body P-ring formation protein FlgA